MTPEIAPGDAPPPPAAPPHRPSETTLADAPRAPRRIVYLIRHAQAWHNVSPDAAACTDPPLTETGMQQAVVLRSIFRPPPEEEGGGIAMHLVLTRNGKSTTFVVPPPVKILASPFRRTLQTALLLFDGEPGPVVAEESIQESGTLNCDTGSPLSVLMDEFGERGRVVVDPDAPEAGGNGNGRAAKRRKSAISFFGRHSHRPPGVDLSRISREEWNLAKRREGDDPYARAWGFKDLLWGMFDEMEAAVGAPQPAIREEQPGGEEKMAADPVDAVDGTSEGDQARGQEERQAHPGILGPIAVVTHGGFLKALLTWDQGDTFTPFANAEIRAYELRLAPVDPAGVRARGGQGGPLVPEGEQEGGWAVIELDQLSMEEMGL
ncbi:histidine phosphatase superfamily [Hyaloraphidium curvatum]|nr:histidine phosphatase superfamily [Hyaloraphidium curvatum]